MNKKALILIDIQNDYFPGGKMELKKSKVAGKNAAKVLNFFREKKLPIIHIQHESIREGSTFFISGTYGMEFHSLVKPEEGEHVIVKHFPNSFRETKLGEVLTKLGITDLTIVGMMSNMCVDATTRAAFDFGYSCTVVHDGCAAAALKFNGEKVSDGKVHASFMAALGSVYAKMVSADELIDESGSN